MFGPRTRSILACAALIGLAGCSALPAGDTEAQAAPAVSATASAGTAQPTSDAAAHPLDRLPELPWDYDLQGALDGDIVKQLTPESDPEALVEALRTVVQLDWMYAQRELAFARPTVESLRGLYRDVEHFVAPVSQASFLQMIQPNIDHAAVVEGGGVPEAPEGGLEYPLYPGRLSQMGGFPTDQSGQQDWPGYEEAVFLGFRIGEDQWEYVPVLAGAREEHAPTRLTGVYDSALHPEFSSFPGFVFEYANDITVAAADGRTVTMTYTRTTALTEHAGRWMVTGYTWKNEGFTGEQPAG